MKFKDEKVYKCMYVSSFTLYSNDLLLRNPIMLLLEY